MIHHKRVAYVGPGSTNTEKPSNREGDAPRYPASTFAPLSGDDDFMEEDEGKGENYTIL